MYQTILVPLDGSKESEAILPQVESLARQHNAKMGFFVQIKQEPDSPFGTTVRIIMESRACSSMPNQGLDSYF